MGVVAALTAWNSPLLFVAWKCAAALAAGCAVIVKPSEFTPASTLEFAALTKEAGIPDGIFNVVTGFGPEIGTELISHPGVAKITFTGSDTTGAKVCETAARSLKRVSLEHPTDADTTTIQILQHHGIIVDKYVLSPHSVSLFVWRAARPLSKLCTR